MSLIVGGGGLVVVTGANGFIGRALCGRLGELGYRVRAAVRRIPENASRLEGVEYIELGDIGTPRDWSRVLTGSQAVAHLAARVHVMQRQESVIQGDYYSTNVAATERLARGAADAGVPRFVYVSSVKVNGEKTPAQGSFGSRDFPQPQDAYAKSKWGAEQTLARVAEKSELEVVILRPPLVYGPGVSANFLKLLQLVERRVPLPLGAVHNRRSLIYLGNLVDAIIACIEKPQAAGQTYLVSDSEPVSTPDLIKHIAAALDISPRLFNCPPSVLRALATIVRRRGAAGRLLDSLVVDASKIRNELDWVPPYRMEQGLEETMRWYLSPERRPAPIKDVRV